MPFIKDLNASLDFVSEWAQLNEEIGDSVFTIDDFYDAFNRAMDGVTALSVDDILPSIEQFKEQPKLYSEVLSEWAAAQQYSVSIYGEINTAAIDEYMDKYIAEKSAQLQLAFPTASNYSAAPGMGALIGAQLGAEQYFNIQLNIDGVNIGKQTVKASSSSTVSVDWNDPWSDNGWGR